VYHAPNRETYERFILPMSVELEALRARITTIADESSGPHPVQSADDSLTVIEGELLRLRIELGAADLRIAELTEALAEYEGSDPEEID
jgi:hypothetical protein